MKQYFTYLKPDFSGICSPRLIEIGRKFLKCVLNINILVGVQVYLLICVRAINRNRYSSVEVALRTLNIRIILIYPVLSTLFFFSFLIMQFLMNYKKKSQKWKKKKYFSSNDWKMSKKKISIRYILIKRVDLNIWHIVLAIICTKKEVIFVQSYFLLLCSSLFSAFFIYSRYSILCLIKLY